MALVMWNIRKERCRVIFQKRLPDADEVVRSCYIAAIEFYMPSSFIKSQKSGMDWKEIKEKSLDKWQLPGQGFVKINYDGTSNKPGATVGSLQG